MDSYSDGDYVVPLAENNQRSRSRRRRSSGQSLEGSAHSTSSYTFEEVLDDSSAHSEYTFETLNDSFHNNSSLSSFGDFGDLAAHDPPPTRVATTSVPPDDSLNDMKSYLRSELGLDTSSPAKPKEEPNRNLELTEMQKYLISELGIDVPQTASFSGPHNPTASSASDLPFSSISVDSSKKFTEDSALARSIAALKEGVDVEIIEYVMSDEEFGEEIIDDIFDHMGGLGGRDTVMLESYGLSAIMEDGEVADSEYASEIDETVHLIRISDVSILSEDFPLVGDMDDDEVDTKPNEPQPTGLHETVIKSNEKLDHNKTYDESGCDEIQKATFLKSGKKAAKWKDRLKKKRSKSDREQNDDDGKMDTDNAPSDEPENQVSATAAEDKGTGPSKAGSPKSEGDSAKKHDNESLTPTKTAQLPDSTKDPKTEVKPKTDSQAAITELTLSKSPESKSPESKSTREKKKAAKWKDRLQKKRTKSMEANEAASISSPKSLNSPDAQAKAEIFPAAASNAENDLQDFPIFPLHERNEKRGSLSAGAKTELLRDETESRDFPVGDIVMKIDGLKKVKANGDSRSDIPSPVPWDKARAMENQVTREVGTASIPPTTIYARRDTIGERDEDGESDLGDNDPTSHSMRIFDDEFGSVGVRSIPFDRSGVSFDLSISNENDDDSLSEQESVYYEKELKNDGSGRRPGSRRDALRVFDDELGDTASYARSSIYSMRSRSSTILQELEEEDNDIDDDDHDDDDHGASGGDANADSMMSEEFSAEPHEGDDNVIPTRAGTASRNMARFKSSRESNGDMESKNTMKFELPNELLEIIHHDTKNVDEKQCDRDVSNVLTIPSETLIEKGEKGSAPYSTLPPTFEVSSPAMGDEAAENADAGISTPEPIEEASQDCTRSGEETAENHDAAETDAKVKSISRKQLKGINLAEVKTDRNTIKVFPGRLPPDQRVMDKETSKRVSFLAAFEMTAKCRRREIVLKSAEIASEGGLPVSAGRKDRKIKSRNVWRGDIQELVESLKVTSRMSTRAGRKELVMESIKATMPKESWISTMKQDDIDQETSASINREIAVKRSADKASGRKTSSKTNGSKRSKADGRNSADSNKPAKNNAKNKKRTKISSNSDQAPAPSNTLELSTKSAPSANPSLSKSMEFTKNSSRETHVDNRNGDFPDGQKENATKTDEGKIMHGACGAELPPPAPSAPKTRSRKRSKPRSRNAPGRSRSLGTENFLASLNPTESLDQVGTSLDDKEDTDGKVTKRTRSRTRGLRRSRSMGLMESARPKRRKEKSNPDDTDPSGGDGSDDAKEKRAGVPVEPEVTEPMSPRTQTGKIRKEQQNTYEQEDSDVLLSPIKSRSRKAGESKSPRVERRSRKSTDGGKSPKNGSRKTIDKTKSPSSRKKILEQLLQSPRIRKKSVDLNEDLKEEMQPPKSPKKNRSSSIDLQSPKAEKPSLRRKKSEGKSPRESNRKPTDKIRTPSTRKKSIDTVLVPDLAHLESELMSPKKGQFHRRSLDSPSRRLAKAVGSSTRRHSDTPLDKDPPPIEDASRQSGAAMDQPSAFMEYYDSVRSPESRRSILKKGDDLLALQEISDSSPSLSPFSKQSKSELRWGQTDSVVERDDVGAPAEIEDIWGLVKWRDQVDRL